MTFGHITKDIRIWMGLEETHIDAAWDMACNLKAVTLDMVLMKRKIRRSIRQIFMANTLKGSGAVSRQRFSADGRIRFKGTGCFVAKRRQLGHFLRRTWDGSKVHASAKASDLRLEESAKGYIQQKEVRQFLTRL